MEIGRLSENWSEELTVFKMHQRVFLVVKKPTNVVIVVTSLFHRNVTELTSN